MARNDVRPVGVRVSADERTRLIRKSSWIGIIGNGLLSVLKIVSGFLFSSFALVGDGIDSLMDVVTSTVTLVTAGIASRPPDPEHPYGHGRAETIATKLLSFIILVAGIQLAIVSVRQMFSPEPPDMPSSLTFIVLAVSITGKIFLSIQKRRVGKRINSPMLIADAKNMRNDIMISLSVMAGVLLAILLHIPILDSVTALLVSFWIVKTGWGIFMETSRELMDGVDDPELYEEVFSVIKGVPGVGNPHKTRIRKLNNLYVIDMDIEVDGTLTVKQGHDIAMQVEAAIMQALQDVYDVQVHVEPTGNYESGETFGLNEELIEHTRKE